MHRIGTSTVVKVYVTSRLASQLRIRFAEGLFIRCMCASLKVFKSCMSLVFLRMGYVRAVVIGMKYFLSSAGIDNGGGCLSKYVSSEL